MKYEEFPKIFSDHINSPTRCVAVVIFAKKAFCLGGGWGGRVSCDGTYTWPGNDSHRSRMETRVSMDSFPKSKVSLGNLGH